MNAYGRLTATSTLVSTITSTATSMVATGGWSLLSTPLLLYIDGELVRATAAASAGGGNVTFTVQRSINGVAKAHTAGAAITLAEPFRLALGPRSGPGLIVPPAPSSLFTTTAALVAAELGPAGHVLAWMPHTTTATSKRDAAGWEAGQFSTFTNDDTSSSFGFWYPNTQVGGPAYAHADYNFVHSTSLAFSGTGYAETIIKSGIYGNSYAAQLWRNLDQTGADLPVTNAGLYFSWRTRFHQTINYDNTDGSTFGFTNQWQWYRTQPSNSPFVTIGAGRNLATDSVMRWHANLDNRVAFDLAQITTPAIPINQWIHMEIFLVTSDGFDGRSGRFKVWQDGVLIIDYSGPTIADYWEKFGVSWGSYGHLLDPDPITIDYDEVLISTVSTHDRLVLPSPTGGNG